MNVKSLALAVVFAASTVAAVAQTPAPPAPPTTPPTTPAPAARPTIGQRKENQQDRIANGVKNGNLTAGQTSHLEHQEAGINHEERGMRAQNNGKLTAQDRKTIHQQQNQESRRIARDKAKTKAGK